MSFKVSGGRERIPPSPEIDVYQDPERKKVFRYIYQNSDNPDELKKLLDRMGPSKPVSPFKKVLKFFNQSK